MDALGMKGKTAVVTGAAQGIGEATALALAEQGVNVAAIDTNEDLLPGLTDRLRQKGVQAQGFAADVSDSAAVNDIIAAVERDMGPIEILANVAGVLRPGPVQSLSDEDWDHTFSVNTTGVFHVSRAVSRYMIERQKGAIVTVGSNAAGVPRASMAAYAASKAAAAMFTKCLGLELAAHHIRCNIVSPGSTETDMQRALWRDENGAQDVIRGSLDTYKTGIPLQKLAKPSDIANAVLFLASEQASHITMHDLCVDGGATLGV
ncbi:2,3-dihydro-2,3-dihydroxybenzoate dehydrogenase [Bacillus velezensis]|uniref:2,3-dihydro-2,3-dihydroxybenzoate dehydrogenase n=1 Tax=Bacillus TaxID=1386 RepID=UPI0013EE5BBF|nr:MULTISPECIES: 2,3-dihydro-2,3-dihydroxybenzoate dehydrogenase [Bacillus]KAF6603263.1 2,3-dihydro-2,3-dihydroxybenzoate dehydrogenase [Bacillus sp. EKM420B]KAF6607816.1 2,3-dihydro-2,3-dihydroxybenzoate dehydrogenase [Bacillus sp. EKM417B]MEC3659271.1 2,3-dihydro-2,3-dihydroxybenzoate dehydrogenase [Bacillus velezensis]MEC3685509.1 2,3-dihydro-2,3-dihydroxybenzoate dehydrogenase [Bacillus velezensis]MEC3788459.1 2,3-dihydro-2,3-dihydroxybenzoate dehydrogenase [Bacillus velezensis]